MNQKVGREHFGVAIMARGSSRAMGLVESLNVMATSQGTASQDVAAGTDSHTGQLEKR